MFTFAHSVRSAAKFCQIHARSLLAASKTLCLLTAAPISLLSDFQETAKEENPFNFSFNRGTIFCPGERVPVKRNTIDNGEEIPSDISDERSLGEQNLALDQTQKLNKAGQEIPCQRIRFQELALHCGEWIEIKGFLYMKDPHSYILAGLPNVRSCCLGSLELSQEQILILHLNALANTRFPVTLRGKLESNTDAPPRYRMDHAVVVD